MSSPVIMNAFTSVKPKSNEVARSPVGLRPGQVLDMNGKPIKMDSPKINISFPPRSTLEDRITRDIEYSQRLVGSNNRRSLASI